MKSKFNININVENISVWVGAVACAGIIVGALFISAVKYTEHSDTLTQNDKQLDAVNLKVPSFEEESMGADDIDAVLSGDMTIAAKVPPPVDAPLEPATPWSYIGASGPEFWADLSQSYEECGKRSQSPVDLTTSAKPNRDLQPIRFIYKNLPGQVVVDEPVLTFRPVQGHSAIIFEESFYLDEIQFHVPAEHQVNGIGYDLEVQLYHRNVSGQIAVVSILANESKSTHGELKKIVSNLPKKPNRPTDLADFRPSEFLPKITSYLHYTGSLTTPPCTSRVRWIVMTNPIFVSDAQIDALSKANGFTARPLQELGGRPVGKSWR